MEQLENKVDVGIHSLKDLPTKLPKGLEIVSVLKRGNHQDVIYSHTDSRILTLKRKSVVGTSSLRRKIKFLKLDQTYILKI